VILIRRRAAKSDVLEKCASAIAGLEPKDRQWVLAGLTAREVPENVLTIGQTGLRDPDNPCYEFKGGPAIGGCDGDGHYLCNLCEHREENREENQ